MTTQEILYTTEHRPFDLPDGSWKFYQEWPNTIFIHWQVELKALEKFVPKAFEIELFEGKPWISLVAFTVENMRPRYIPAFKPISDFHEVNIRTYVKFNNKPGIYFLSIEAAKLVPCIIAKVIMELPYRHSKIKRHNGIYQSTNKKHHDQLHLEYAVGPEKTQKTELEKWLTERYVLFEDSKNSVVEFDIHHMEWPLKDIQIKELNVNYPRFKDLIKNKPALAHYSNGVEVLTWHKKKHRL